ncbi:MAG TPA: Gfo/Idh/MocA family oxidoreductase [Rhizomicrobium sp.]|jgi:predicted dehydrogenase
MGTTLRLGILGCARISKHAVIDPARRIPGLEIAAVASRDRARSEAYAKDHAIARAYGDYAALLDDPDIDAIYNPLPNSLHAEWSIRALEAGKDVLCEKPLASNAAQAARMRDAAHRTGRLLVEAFHYRYHPAMQFIETEIASGRLGKILHAEAVLAIPASLVPRDDIRFQFDLAGGAMMDLGAYCANGLRHVMRAEPTVESAKATVVATDVDGAMEARLRFTSGATAALRCSLIGETLESRLVVEGERGRIVAENPFLSPLPHSADITIDGKSERRDFDSTPTFVFQAEAFRDAVRTRREPLTTAADGVANMVTIDSIYRAAGLALRG